MLAMYDYETDWDTMTIRGLMLVFDGSNWGTICDDNLDSYTYFSSVVANEF